MICVLDNETHAPRVDRAPYSYEKGNEEFIKQNEVKDLFLVVVLCVRFLSSMGKNELYRYFSFNSHYANLPIVQLSWRCRY